MWKIQGACCICQYKDIVILEREIITVELLVTKSAHQPLLSSLYESREIQWNWMLGKARHDCWFFYHGCIHYGNMNQGLYLLFHYLRQGTTSLEDCYFVSDKYKKSRYFLSKRCLNSYEYRN